MQIFMKRLTSRVRNYEEVFSNAKFEAEFEEAKFSGKFKEANFASSEFRTWTFLMKLSSYRQRIL